VTWDLPRLVKVVTVITDRNNSVTDVNDATTEDLEENDGDPGAIRGASLKGESRPLRSTALAFGDPPGMQGEVMVTRARFERATPSFGDLRAKP
jgi:hypothetical protein